MGRNMDALLSMVLRFCFAASLERPATANSAFFSPARIYD